MTKPIREMRENGIYHVCNRGNNKMYIFHDKQDKERFLARLFKLQKKYGFTVIVFCIMDNHFHLLIKDNLLQLPDYIGALEDYYAKYHNWKYYHVGHVFQGRFKSCLIKNELDILINFRYIVRNPVVAGISNSIFNYSWTVIDENSRYFKFVNFEIINNCLDKTGNPSLNRYIDDNVDDLWAHEIERSIRDDDEAADIYKRYISNYGINISNSISLLKSEEQICTIKFLFAMGLSSNQIKKLTKLSLYKIKLLKNK